MDLIIFGAQGTAISTYKAIQSLYPKRNVKCFLVTSMGINPSLILNIPVLELGQLSSELSQKEKDNTEILVATPENIHDEIEESLERNGFRCHVRMDSGRMADLMKMYHTRLGRFQTLPSLPVGFHETKLTVFAVKSHKDKAVYRHYEFPEWICYVQAGAAMCEQRIAALADNTGDNISDRNGNYCELTVLYWIWKTGINIINEDSEYVGLVQYRRIFEFEQDDLLRLRDNDVDVVLPYPMSYEPDISVHHERYLKKADWSALLAAIHELYPEYVADFEKILSQKYLYNYNIMIAKKQVLIDYCEWLFPLLNRVEELSEPKGSERSDRYIGYIGETLETVYFLRNSERLNIVHTGCRLLK